VTLPLLPLLPTQTTSAAATDAASSSLFGSHSLAVPLPSLMAPLPELSSQAVYRSPRRVPPLQRVLQGTTSVGGSPFLEKGGGGGSSGGGAGASWETGGAITVSSGPLPRPPMRASTALPLTTQDSTSSQEVGSVASSIVQRHKSGILSRDQHGILRFAVLPRVPPPDPHLGNHLLMAPRFSVDAAVLQRERATRMGHDQGGESDTSGPMSFWAGAKEEPGHPRSHRGRSVDQVMGDLAVEGVLSWGGARVPAEGTGPGEQQYMGNPFQAPAEGTLSSSYQVAASGPPSAAGPAPRGSLHRLRVSASGPDLGGPPDAAAVSSDTFDGEGPPASPPLCLNASDI
jgi:hypothetical protein